MSTDIVLHYAAALAYLLLACSIWYPLRHGFDLSKYQLARHLGLLFTLVVHGLAISYALIYPGYIKFNWALSLSFTLWLGMCIFWVESNFVSLKALLLPLSLLSALMCVLTGLFPTSTSGITVVVEHEIFRFHLIVSLFAYSVIALATLQALVTASVDRYLHRPHQFHSEQKMLHQLVAAQPPLLLQERLLFRLIWVGFALMTLSIITGAIVSWQFNAQLLPWDHKTFFTLTAWVVFAFLLAGRTLWGWRGRIALRWNIIGFILLMMAYTGSRFVYEVILGL